MFASKNLKNSLCSHTVKNYINEPRLYAKRAINNVREMLAE